MTHYLTRAEMMLINEEITGKRAKPRDMDMLESAVLRPMASAFGEDAYGTVVEKAAALLHSLSRNHAFVDGNKRTSTIALILFLRLNGYQVIWEPEKALDFILEAATGQLDLETITAWLSANTTLVETPVESG
ncbi:MAG: type II toxin-antitoxin system death-on-curing family toxin [Anaerolineae bacterium]